MPLCGFNQEMLEGLTKFHKGLVEHGIINRSEKRKETLEKTISNEIRDMHLFLKEIHRIKDPELRQLTEMLTKYALAFYNIVQKKNVANYQKLIEFLSRFYFAMDKKYYSELEGKEDAMRELTIYLNTIKN